MTYGVKTKLDLFDERIRKIERGLEKAELREKQLIIMFKMILDKHLITHRKKGTGKKITTIKDIIEFMEQIVNKNLTPSELMEQPDLLSEVIKKSY